MSLFFIDICDFFCFFLSNSMLSLLKTKNYLGVDVVNCNF